VGAHRHRYHLQLLHRELEPITRTAGSQHTSRAAETECKRWRAKGFVGIDVSASNLDVDQASGEFRCQEFVAEYHSPGSHDRLRKPELGVRGATRMRKNLARAAISQGVVVVVARADTVLRQLVMASGRSAKEDASDESLAFVAETIRPAAQIPSPSPSSQLIGNFFLRPREMVRDEGKSWPHHRY
jgi:hypothetical protein